MTFIVTGLTKTGTATFNVNPGALDHFAITETTGSALTDKTAGSAFNVKIVAQDVNNNTVTGFGATVSITASGSTLTGSPVTSGTFTSGILSSQSLTLTTSGTGVTLSASGGGKSGTSGTFNVTAAGLDHFAIRRSARRRQGRRSTSR